MPLASRLLPRPVSNHALITKRGTAAYATANLVSRPRDVQRFAQALLTGELLRPDTLATMLTFVSGKGQYKMPHPFSRTTSCVVRTAYDATIYALRTTATLECNLVLRITYHAAAECSCQTLVIRAAPWYTARGALL